VRPMDRSFFSPAPRHTPAKPSTFLALALAAATGAVATTGCNLFGGGCDPDVVPLDAPDGGEVTGAGVGVGGSASSGEPSGHDAGNLCAALAAADAGDTGDAGGAGCSPHAPGMICGPSGCTSLCLATDYEMTCTSPDMSAPIPAPAPSLGCTIITIPTPSDVLFYCCPCEG
jgi:hypothetical protein